MASSSTPSAVRRSPGTGSASGSRARSSGGGLGGAHLVLYPLVLLSGVAMGAGFSDRLRSLLPNQPHQTPSGPHLAAAPAEPREKSEERHVTREQPKTTEETSEKRDRSELPEEPRTHGTPETMMGAAGPDEGTP